MAAEPSIKASAERFREIPRIRLHREAFGRADDKNAPVIYKCEIPDYWTDDLRTCITLGERVRKWGWPFGPWGDNPAILIEAVELYDEVLRGWREENAS